MRRALIALAIPLLFAVPACSSSKGSSKGADSSTTSTATANTGTIGGGKTAADKTLCAGVQQFADAAEKVGTTAAQWKVAATALKAAAIKIKANPPASIKAAANTYADTMNTAAATINSASSSTAAHTALVPLVYNTKHNADIKAFGDWVDKHC
jgi:hypothetical protein